MMEYKDPYKGKMLTEIKNKKRNFHSLIYKISIKLKLKGILRIRSEKASNHSANNTAI